jgi:hypothetical protein
VFPFREIRTAYVVAKPLASTSTGDAIALVHWHVNPDQLAALVTLAGFERGAVETGGAGQLPADRSPAKAAGATIADRLSPHGKDRQDAVFGHPVWLPRRLSRS